MEKITLSNGKVVDYERGWLLKAVRLRRQRMLERELQDREFLNRMEAEFKKEKHSDYQKVI